MAGDREGRARGGSRVTYRVAVVGLGRIGWLADRDPVRPKPASHVSAWNSAPRAELVAVCDSATDRMAYKPALDYLHVEDMFRLAGPFDIVSVVTPPATHREIVETCATAGVRLIVCEKPLAPTVKDAEAMVEACRASGTILLVNHGRRFHPMIRAVKAELDRGRIGRPLSAIAACSGGLWSGTSHMVDLLRWFLGDVTEAVGYRRGPCSEDGMEAGYDAHLWFSNGVTASLHAVDIRRYVQFAMTIFGEEGIFMLDEAGLRARWGKAEASYPLASGYRHVVRDNGLQAAPTTFLGEMAAHAVAVLDGTERPFCTGEDGLAAVRVLDTLESSS
mgnify:CR=1 FL=1